MKRLPPKLKPTKIPQILSFTDESGTDNMDKEINANYRQTKLDIAAIITAQLERIENHPELVHLIRKE